MSAEALGVAFAAAIEFLRSRLALPEGAWDSLLDEAGAAAVDRSRGMSAALERDILEAVLRAQETGSTFATFLDDWTEATRRAGWEPEEGASSARRAALVFRSSIKQAQAAGRWKSIQEAKSRRPYLRYVHVDPGLTQRYSREIHASWHGTILPVDHPWWRTHYPPNGWNCRCTTQSLNDRDLKRRGWTVAAEPPPSRMRTVFVGGRPVDTPEGIDPGFAFNAGELGLRLPPAG